MISAAYAANGATVVVTSRKKDVVQATVDELNLKYGKSHGGKAVGIPGDLSTYEGVVKFVEDLKAQFDKVHVLVNNAGATWGGELGEFPDKAWPRVMDLNVRHVFNLTQLLLPLLNKAAKQDDPARVIMIASVEGLRPSLTLSPMAAYSYSASKGALVHLTKTLTRSFAQHNLMITVNCIAPGVFPSNMSKELVSSDAVAQANPMKRFGRTADMAATALYLAGIGGGFTNGAIIAVDGGAQFLN